MFFAADIGNSNIVIAINDGVSWVQKYRFETKDERPIQYYEAGLADLLLEWRINPAEIKTAAISSVVPNVTEKIIAAIQTNFRIQPLVLAPDIFMQLDMHIPKIYEIGSDLVANGFAAMHKIENNSIIVDFGTALTFTVFHMDEGIKGVTIAPGLQTIISTLSGNTAQLPKVDIAMPESAIGVSTNTAIRAGVLFGYIGLVKELLSRIKSEVDGDYKVIATGGLCTVLPELRPLYDVIEKDLTLDGIKLIHDHSINYFEEEE